MLIKSNHFMEESKMKNLKLMLGALLMIVLTVGCSKDKQETPSSGEVSPKEVINQIQAELAKAYDVSLEDGVLPGYALIDMTNQDEMAMYEGIFNPEDIKSGYILQNLMNVRSELIMVAEGKDAKATESIKSSYEKVLSNQEATWSTYLPDQYELVKNNKIKTKGNYILYVTSEESEKIIKLCEKAVK